MGCPPHPPKFYSTCIYLTPPSLCPSHQSQPTCQDGLVNPEGGGFDGKDADVCGDFVPNCRESRELVQLGMDFTFSPISTSLIFHP